MGQDKAHLKLDGRPLISIVIERLRQVCSDAVIVTSDAEQFHQMTLTPIIRDIFPNVGVLGGLHAGLTAASCELALVVACDMPYLMPDLLTAFADWASGFDVVVLRQGEYVEPLHAAYRKTCLPAIEHAIRTGKRRVISFFPEDPFQLDELAQENNVTAIVDCGVAPGMSNIILGYHNSQMNVNKFECYVGGLPEKREWPWE